MGYHKVYLKITVGFLAKKSGRCEETVRRHIKSGMLIPSDLEAIQKWLNKKGKVIEDKAN